MCSYKMLNGEFRWKGFSRTRMSRDENMMAIHQSLNGVFLKGTQWIRKHRERIGVFRRIGICFRGDKDHDEEIDILFSKNSAVDIE